MKCEKCGKEILEGTICENCKNNIQTEESQNVVPQQYDPVANLMSEPVDANVNKEKSDLENTIPLGDNTEIPATPVNENVVSVSSTNVTPNEQTVAVEENVTSENQKSQQPDVQTNNQEQLQQSQTVQQPVTQKKTKTSTIIIIAVAVALAMFIIFFVLPMIKSAKSTLDMFDQAKTNTFVTEIQYAMDEANQSFMSDAMESPGSGIVYSNMKDVNNPTAKEIKEYNSNGLYYYMELDRHGKYQIVTAYNDNYCYDSTKALGKTDITKTEIKATDVYKREKNDSHTGCTGEKIEMQ